ncbi:hypothetical protein AVMA1855_04935 [Acidovorax sp. SUPP1855]|uniref:hypothetical protein n=1 Tax=Acidovorax sp. SUPP1855 TaxID=431774 RepID=UPI0023DE53E8|nr:hypothetical protein [Acidovorax sp. SUPP1855]GKS83461.1 hypothetical protein AVMA1855_04935 [Acidovorax sp. SUPP1855]
MAPRSPLQSGHAAIRSTAQQLRQQQETIANLLEHAVQYPGHEGMKSVVRSCEKLNRKITAYLVQNRGSIGPDDVRQMLTSPIRLVEQHRAEVAARMVADDSDEEQPSYSQAGPSSQSYNPAEFEVTTVFSAGQYDYGHYLR